MERQIEYENYDLKQTIPNIITEKVKPACIIELSNVIKKLSDASLSPQEVRQYFI